MSEYRFINPEDQEFLDQNEKIEVYQQELREWLSDDIFELNPLQARMVFTQKAKDLNQQNSIRINLLNLNLISEGQIRKLQTDLATDPNNLDLKRRIEDFEILREKVKILSEKFNA